jgi:hypothetical protein
MLAIFVNFAIARRTLSSDTPICRAISAIVHKVCSTFPAFEFQARPVISVEDAVRVELEAIAWRDGLKGK